MNRKILIAGAGGIGRAAGLLLREVGDFDVDLYIGDANGAAAKEAAEWIAKDSIRPGEIIPFEMPRSESNSTFDEFLKKTEIILDCLPGSQAPRIARLAKNFNLHYANLTEYVEQTNEVIEIARDANKGFILQTGLAPGFVDVLANGLFQRFCRTYGVDKVESVNMKVGALTQNAYPPHFYGFTWSPVGVATLYVEPAKVIRNYQITIKSSRTERSRIVINGVTYEEDLTSGGAADLPEVLAGKTRSLDYKTIRYPGHYEWVEGLVRDIPYGANTIEELQKKMEELIPLVEEDYVVLSASVVGRDSHEKLRSMEKSYFIHPVTINDKKMRAIQATTAAALVESARLLLSGKYRGCIQQSQIDWDEFSSGPFVSAIYK